MALSQHNADYISACIEGYCSWVCVSVKSHLESLFILKILLHTEQATEVKNLCGFCLKLLCCRDPALPMLKAIRIYSQPFSCGKHACALGIYRIVENI